MVRWAAREAPGQLEYGTVNQKQDDCGKGDKDKEESGEDQNDGFGDPGGPHEGHQESLKSLFGRGKR